MSETILVLGPVAFEDFEIPSGISFGGKQRLAIHEMPGGARVIDSLGRDDTEITFSGIFSGQDATLRARSLDELRALGQTLPLTWDVFFYSVIIRSFEADYRSPWWIPYQIACTVLRDEASAAVETAISLAASVISDISAAATQAITAGIDLSSTQSALLSSKSTVRGTDAYGLARTSLSAAQTSVAAQLSQSEASLDGSALFARGPASTAAASLGMATSQAQSLAALVQARSYLGRAAINLSNAST
ncbi:MAG: hypothetical protein JOY71_19685 [Acetobacteraceae bacterium]|nr:hypothetical protein [Acetobacteraceae bacterium]